MLRLGWPNIQEDDTTPHERTCLKMRRPVSEIMKRVLIILISGNSKGACFADMAKMMIETEFTGTGKVAAASDGVNSTRGLENC